MQSIQWVILSVLVILFLYVFGGSVRRPRKVRKKLTREDVENLFAKKEYWSGKGEVIYVSFKTKRRREIVKNNYSINTEQR
jgi:uncharacterized membrane protein